MISSMSVLYKEINRLVRQGGQIAPLLFLWENPELLHAELLGDIHILLKEYEIDTQSLFHLEDDGESLKIWEVKNFLSHGDIRPRFAFQVFFIENISRMTTQAQNACLKFFEEPGKGNIIILTNNAKSWVLDTILSRVQIISSSHSSFLDFNFSQKRNNTQSFYYSMIESHVLKNSDELVRYFFSGKYEKWEYINFLEELVWYITNSGNFLELLDEIHEDIWGISKNNLQGRYIVDKYIMKLRN